MIEAGRVEDLRVAVPRLREEARRPAGPEGIEEAIRPWFATYPQPERDEQKWVEFWGAYVIVCGHMSAAALRGAMATWAKRADAQFLPKPGQLLEIAQNTPTPASRLAAHAWQVLNQCDDMLQNQRLRQSMDDDDVKPEEQRRAVAELAAGYTVQSLPAREAGRRILQRGVKGAERPESEQPYIGGTPPTGHGITREMMRTMGWAEPPPDHVMEPRDEIVFSEDH